MEKGLCCLVWPFVTPFIASRCLAKAFRCQVLWVCDRFVLSHSQGPLSSHERSSSSGHGNRWYQLATHAKALGAEQSGSPTCRFISERQGEEEGTRCRQLLFTVASFGKEEDLWLQGQPCRVKVHEPLCLYHIVLTALTALTVFFSLFSLLFSFTSICKKTCNVRQSPLSMSLTTQPSTDRSPMCSQRSDCFVVSHNHNLNTFRCTHTGN